MTIFGIRVYLYTSSFPDLLTTDVLRTELELFSMIPKAFAWRLTVNVHSQRGFHTRFLAGDLRACPRIKLGSLRLI